MDFMIPSEELELRASRAGGPGGQHVNKTSTRVEVRWNIRTSPSLSDAQRHRLERVLGKRIDRQGRVRVVSGARRSQTQNRLAAIERLHGLINAALHVPKPRKRTKTPSRVKKRRVEQKRRRSKEKQRRQRPSLDD